MTAPILQVAGGCKARQPGADDRHVSIVAAWGMSCHTYPRASVGLRYRATVARVGILSTTKSPVSMSAVTPLSMSAVTTSGTGTALASPAMSSLLPVYLAGPDVFRPDAFELGQRKKEICARFGLDGRFPLTDLVLPENLPSLPLREQAQAFFEACASLMVECVAGIANLTPFRGVSADVGTVFEHGFLLGEGKPVFGYTSEMDHYQDRVVPDGLFIEPFGLCDNLMLEGATMRFAPGVVRVESTDGDHGAAMEAFEACVKAASAALHRDTSDRD